MTDVEQVYDDVRGEIGQVLVGYDEAVERLMIAALTRGHVLLEGVPGIAKTTMAHLFARATGLDYNRIQMTPDTLPADVTGTQIYREGPGTFELQKGPVFANVVVADEINRATPKTQSALLEAMQERRVTIEGETLDLPDPFLVIATKNPIEMEGVFALPEAQRDRFQMKLAVDLPERSTERELLDRFDAAPDLGPETVAPAVEPADLIEARSTVEAVYVDGSVKEYVLDLVTGTRTAADVEHGGSPRASLAFLSASKARAALQGRDYVIPDDIKALAKPVLVHRLVLSADAELGDASPASVVEDVVSSVTAPGGPDDGGGPATAVSDGGTGDEPS